MELRAPRPGEAESVAALLEARDVADFGRRDFTLDDLRAEWGNSGFDLARDATVCEADGLLAGYAMVRRRGTFGAVAPTHEGRGIGTRLIRWTERRQNELGWERYVTGVAAGNARARELVLSRGYELSFTSTRLVLRFPATVVDAPPPAGVTLRALDPAKDGRAVYEIDGAAFASASDVLPRPYQEFAERHLAAHDLDTSVSRVAVDADGVAGFAMTRRWAAEGAAYVAILAVAPASQGRGIGRALLGDVIRAARADGLNEVQLSVASDNPNALRLYESFGMQGTVAVDVYQRSVAGGPAGLGARESS
ncbi:MAG TPA: GNAT family N-acetyltransferase [Solirubrobacteraceae bacterium]|nr:GNAT family N-acetyltransferase [Solirubrobacteraceae bacterium]